MKVIELTQGRVAIVDDEDFEYLAQYRWHYANKAGGDEYSGYAVRAPARVQRGVSLKKLSMHREIMKTPEGMQCDHVNGNKLDNRRCNLRNATNSQNRHNVGPYKNNKFGLKGVSKKRDKFQAQIMVNYVPKFLGSFDTPQQAHEAYRIAATELHKEFARLN